MKFIYDNFDLLFDEAGSVDAFKKLILDMAVRGKLVPQDSNDESATLLIAKIQKEKERLVKEGLLNKEKPLPPIKQDEVPFDLPDGWEWVRLGEVVIFNPRNRLEDNLDVSFIPMKLIDQSFNYKHSSEIKTWKDIKNGFTHFMENDVVFAKITPCFQNRKSAILRNLKNNYGAGTTELQVMRTIDNLVHVKYLLSVIKTQRFIENGVKSYTGTAGQQRISKAFCTNYLFPLPPLNEQTRIVQKIDEIFEMIPQLEEVFEKRTKYNRQLNRTSLYRLTDANSGDDFISSIQFVTNNFDLLYDNIENVKELRQAILTLAVQGKLVPQDPNDEPASVLLEKIQKEKERLINEGKLKKERPLPPIKQGEVPFNMPDGWEWVRFDSIVMPNNNSIRRGPFGSSIRKDMFVPKSDGSYKVYEQKNAIKKDYSLGSYYITKNKFEELRNFVAKAGDIIISCAGTIGETYLLPNEAPEGVINQALLKITLNNKIILDEYFLYLFANLTRVSINQNAKGSAMKNIMSIDVLKKTMLPLPPYQEQKYIVAKINKLMAFCDDLENHLYKCEHISEQLLTVVLYEAI